MIDGIGLKPYEERLKILKLTTLIERRARGGLIEVFKIFKGLYTSGENFLKFSRSGTNIVLGDNCAGVHSFQMRVARFWNKIPVYVKMADNILDFKSRLENFKVNNINKPGHFWELSDEVFKRIDDSNRTSYVDFMCNNQYIAKRKM